MVISVFPDYGQAIDRYRSTRSERLERQAQETQRAAYNRLLGQVQDPLVQQAMSNMDPDAGSALLVQRRDRSQQAQAEALTAQQEQAQRFQSEVMFPALQEAASAYQGMEGEERTQFASNLTRRLNIQAQAYGGRGQATPETIEQMLAGYAPAQPEYNNPQRGINPATGREEFFVTDERGQPRFIGVQGPEIRGQNINVNTPVDPAGQIVPDERRQSMNIPSSDTRPYIYTVNSDGRVTGAVPLGPEGDSRPSPEQARGMAVTMDQQSRVVRDRLEGIIGEAGPLTTGWGSLLAIAPNTPARDFMAQVETIVANIGFDELQEMRDNSPTGGALGQVTVREIELLQALRGSLDRGQSAGQFKENAISILSQLNELEIERRFILRREHPEVYNELYVLPEMSDEDLLRAAGEE